MNINDFVKKLEELVFEHGDTCKVITVIAKKTAEQKKKNNLHPSMQQALKPFLKFQ